MKLAHEVPKHTTGGYVVMICQDGSKIATEWHGTYDTACDRVRDKRRQGDTCMAVMASEVKFR